MAVDSTIDPDKDCPAFLTIVYNVIWNQPTGLCDWLDDVVVVQRRDGRIINAEFQVCVF
jgi:hypothetical protein